jgi:hypothetical protein
VKSFTVSAEEMNGRLAESEKVGGVAEIVILLRAFGAEEQLADAMTHALGGISGESGARDDVERCW